MAEPYAENRLGAVRRLHGEGYAVVDRDGLEESIAEAVGPTTARDVMEVIDLHLGRRRNDLEWLVGMLAVHAREGTMLPPRLAALVKECAAEYIDRGSARYTVATPIEELRPPGRSSTIAIEVLPEAMAQLREHARQSGNTVVEYIRQCVANQIAAEAER